MLTEVKIIFSIILAGLLFWGYYTIGNHAVDAYKAQETIKQAGADKLQRERYDALEGRYEALKSKREDNVRVVTKQVEKIVTRSVYRNECIDSEGLELINSAILGSKIEN